MRFWLLTLLLCSPVVGANPVPRAEHPRPDFERKQWQSLNGAWEFQFGKPDAIEAIPSDGWDKKITVPFPWESSLSGIGKTKGETVGWYRRTVTVPAAWAGFRVWLNFGAVDWAATIWVNGRKIGSHEGGYSPFSFDITDALVSNQLATVVVAAVDPTSRDLPTGKQIFWYTTTSGIWQSVWLEARPATYLADWSYTTRPEGQSWVVDARFDVAGTDGPTKVRLVSTNHAFEPVEVQTEVKNGAAQAKMTFSVLNPRLWSPEHPNLYEARCELSGPSESKDEVGTYFALRTIARGKYDSLEHESILLNGKPVYLRGALDQSFNPQGIYTAPSDDFLRGDIELAKRLGLNFLRIHIKAEEPRRLYWADKLGLLIMQDMPNTWAQNAKARAAWEATMRATILRDRRHPSIIAWCIFNETWGLGNGIDYGADFRRNRDTQDWVERMWRLAKELDPSRLVEDNSPDKRDHVRTDLNSWHFYIDDYPIARRHIAEVVVETRPGSPFNYVPGRKQGSEPLINSEYGAVSAAGGDRDVSWGFRYLTTQIRRHSKIQGYIYTELSDIEWEHNGFVDYDRRPKDFGYDAFIPGLTVADLQRADFVGFDAPPAIEIAATEDVRVPVFVSHFSERTNAPSLRYGLVAVDDLGQELRTAAQKRPVKWEPYRVTEQEAVAVRPPTGRAYVGAVTLELVDEADKRIAANFVNVIAHPTLLASAATKEPPARSIEILSAKETALRFSPQNVAQIDWPKAPAQGRSIPGKFLAHGSGWLEYRIALPDFVRDAKPIRLELLAEVAAKAGKENVDWSSRPSRQDYPQTDARKFPSRCIVRLNGEKIADWQLEDDPADARGVLSHQARLHHGSYGYLMKASVDLTAPAFAASLQKGEPLVLRFEVPTEGPAGGLTIFGRRVGRYPLDPTLRVFTAQPLNRPVGWTDETTSAGPETK